MKKILTFVKRRKSIKLHKFFAQVDSKQFKVILNAIEPCDKIMGYTMPEITKMPYGQVMGFVEDCQEYTPFEMVKEFLKMQEYRVSDVKLLKLPANEFMRFLKHLTNEVNRVIAMLAELRSEPKAKLINAGIDKLNPFGVANIYYSLDRNPSKWKEFAAIPFYEMYVMQLMDKINAEINEKLNDPKKNN